MNQPDLAIADSFASSAVLRDFSVGAREGQPAESAEDSLPSSEQVQREIAGLLDRPLSPFLSRWADSYARVGKRSPYLWKWVRRAVELTTLPCVAPGLHDEVCDTKALGVMFDVLLDDVADQKGNAELLEQLLGLFTTATPPDFSRFSTEEQAYGRFATDVWSEIHARAKTYPHYAIYADVLRFDYLQLANVMRYSHLLNAHPDLLNLTEHDLYTPHNMHIIICSTFDVMCSPQFIRSELGKLREIVWCAQCMGRIGNLVTTWQRELGEGDFTSGVYARAVMCGDLTVADLQVGDRAKIEAAIGEGGHEAYFLRRWANNRQYLRSQAGSLRSFDVGELARAFERLICLHLGSRGYK